MARCFDIHPANPQQRVVAQVADIVGTGGVIAYRDGANPAVVTSAYMASPEFAADMDGFDGGNIVNVEELVQEPAAALTLS